MTTGKRGKRGGNHGGGRPQKALSERAAFAGKIAIRITPETAALAQRLMLYNWPGVSTIEELFAYALRRLAETTDD